MNYRVGVIIPTRGDRPRFFEHCVWLLKQQTVKPVAFAIMDYAPESGQRDITQRYRRGYDSLRNMELDAVFLIEDDDWYSPTYFQETICAWELAGKPDLFGQRSTIYYHIKQKGFFVMRHEQRGAAMNTLIKPDMNFPWCADSEPYTDCWLYFNLIDYKLWQPKNPNCIGIKHGVGLTGGGSHVTGLERFTSHPGIADPEMNYLRSVVDPSSFKFYCDYSNK